MGAAPPAWRVQEHDELASTQDAAMAASQAGDPGRLAILARRQSTARGSRGRAWESPAGNLALSVLMRPDASHPPGHYALLAGVALFEALSPFAGGLMLKWPNDLLLDGAKLGGVLIDGTYDAPAWFVIGIGANLEAAPSIAGRRTACLPAPAPAARVVADGVLDALDRFSACEDIAGAWLERGHPVGTGVTIRLPQGEVSGVFDGLSEMGSLVLRGRAEPVSCGEVFLCG